MSSSFKTISAAAQRERKYAIDPRQEESPHGDFPWDHTPMPLKADRMAGHDLRNFLMSGFGMAMLIIVVAMIVWIGLNILDSIVGI